MKQLFPATVLVACLATSASADEIIFLSANALESSVRELIPHFERTIGHTVKVSFGNVSNNAERVRKGDSVDLAITSPKLRADLQAEGKIAAEPNVVIAKVGFGLFVKKARKSRTSARSMPSGVRLWRQSRLQWATRKKARPSVHTYCHCSIGLGSANR